MIIGILNYKELTKFLLFHQKKVILQKNSIMLKLNTSYLWNFISKEDYQNLSEKSLEINADLNNPQGTFSDYTGWVDLPFNSDEIINKINDAKSELKKRADILVSIGIGGSYLGAKAVISALTPEFATPKVIFAGMNLSENYLLQLIDYLQDKNFALCVISKSGTTTEPAVSFRILKELLIEKVGEEEANRRIVAITDREKGALVQMANKYGYTKFEIPGNIGGRFSVLTPVGLFPIAFAGFDIKKLIEGAAEMAKTSSDNASFDENIAAQYAIIRNLLLQKGKNIEIMVNYNPRLHYFAEWWKQLFGESEGKENKGIFPASVDFTTDLHSLGQYIQEGQRMLFETVLNITEQPEKLFVRKEDENLDNLNYLAGKSVEYINSKAMEGTINAHISGNVPNIVLDIPKINEYYLGQMIYFFEKACGISAILLGVHPFNQPGVEAYKKNMFKLLGKPGV